MPLAPSPSLAQYRSLSSTSNLIAPELSEARRGGGHLWCVHEGDVDIEWHMDGVSVHDSRGRRRPSTVQSPGAKTASANAAAAAEKTEAFKADLSPVPTVIPNANRNRRTPLTSADHRVKNPRIRATPRMTSATVAAQANAGTVGAGAHGFTRAVYAVKRWKSPHATLAVPAGPDRPNRSATPLRKAAPSARRKKTDA